ncbi:MAG: glycerol-3-phosphate 1-O-acyltransferase PlsY [Oscillospiraceae bacterium]
MNWLLILTLILSAVFAYLLGSISTAVVVSKSLKKEDVRDYGSHNAGMTNTLRVYGKLAALYTSIGDLFKGVFAVVIARLLVLIILGEGFNTVNSEIAGCIAAICAISGHIFPCFFNFKGGKGILTSLGVFICIDWRAALICFSVFLILVAITRYVSLGSIVALGLAPFVTFGVRYFWGGGEIIYATVCAALMGGLTVFMHRGNIKRLMNGTENKLSKKKKTAN